MKIIILTEGGKNFGFGHITRCIGLYQYFEREEGAVPIMFINGDKSIKYLLSNIKYNIFNWLNQDEKILSTIKSAEVVIIDSYLADKDFYRKVSERVKTALFFDDYKRIDYPKGIVVNGSIYAKEIKYPNKNGINYLLGPKYIILRKEFGHIARRKIKKGIKRILISFGGINHVKLISQITNYLSGKFNYTFNCIGVRNKVDAEKIRDAMLTSDCCISGGGQTVHELARCGIPTLGICFADNQLLNLKKWESAGFLKFVGWQTDKNLFINIEKALLNLHPQKQLQMQRIGRKLVDGQGAKRIVKEILSNMNSN